MTTYGLTNEGFVPKTIDVIQDEVDEALKSKFGKYINTLPQSVFGQLKGIFSEREALLWELAEAIYNSQYPDTAEGTSQDNVLALTGLKRLDARYSKSIGQAFVGTAGTTVPQGTKIHVQNNTGSVFSTDADLVLSAGVDEVQGIAFAPAPASGSFKLVYKAQSTVALNWNDSAATIQAALRALTGLETVVVTGSIAAGLTITFTGVSSGLRPHDLLTTDDNTLLGGGAVPVVITITESTPGEYQGTVDCTADDTGPISGNENTLTEIMTPVSGLSSTYNPDDIQIGRDIETSAEARIRREENLQISDAGPVEAIRSKIIALNDIEGATVFIESCIVFENVTNAVDARGLNPKSIKVYVYQTGGVTTRDDEIAEAIFASKPGGIETMGSVSKTVVDSQGINHTIKSDRPTAIPIYLDLVLTVDSDYPTDGDDQVLAAILAWGNGLGVGKDVIIYGTNSFSGILSSIPGITDVTIDIGKTSPPSGDANIDIDDGTGGNVEFSQWESGNINITS